jgi:hypothetical protein
MAPGRPGGHCSCESDNHGRPIGPVYGDHSYAAIRDRPMVALIGIVVQLLRRRRLVGNSPI